MIFVKDAGLSEKEITRVKEDADVEGWSTFDATLLRAVEELHCDSFVSDETWTALSVRYNEKQLMDVVFTVGQYNIVLMALNSFGEQLDSGGEGF